MDDLVAHDLRTVICLVVVVWKWVECDRGFKHKHASWMRRQAVRHWHADYRMMQGVGYCNLVSSDTVIRLSMRVCERL